MYYKRPQHASRNSDRPLLRQPNSGFTLVELLIVAAIMLILLTLTVAVYMNTAPADRIRSSARQIQSAISGARDRAIKAGRGANGGKSRRGLRLLVDANDPSVVTSFVYVGAEEPWTDGQVVVGRQDLTDAMGMGGPDGYADNSNVRTVRGWPRVMPDGSISTTRWKALYDQGLLINGARIRIPAGPTGSWYTVNTTLLATYANVGPEILLLNTEYQQPPPPVVLVPPLNGADSQPGVASFDDDQDGVVDNPQELGAPPLYATTTDDNTDINAFGNVGAPYELELLPTVLPGSEPLRLSSGIAIDLDNSNIYSGWFLTQQVAAGSAAPAADINGAWSFVGTNGTVDFYRQYSAHMDIMFSTLGSVVGPISAFGAMQLRLAEVEDIAQKRDPADPQAGLMLYSAVFTQTGYVASFPVDITDNVNNTTGLAPKDGYADDPLAFTRTGSTLGR